MSLPRTAPAERFWKYVRKGHWNDCWLWRGAVHSTGYGRFQIAKGKSIEAHRAALAFAKGISPDGLGKKHVLHSCDNRPCCNPNHLRLGTPKDNMEDRELRGRHPHKDKGSKSHRAKLTHEQVVEIRRAHPTEWGKIAALAKSYNVSDMTIFRILSNRTYKGE